MNDKEKLNLIRDYIKENIGGFKEETFYSVCNFTYTMFSIENMMTIKVSLDECNVQAEAYNIPRNIELVMKFKDWFAENIAKSECKYIRKSYSKNIECIRWDYIEHENEDVWNDVINELTESGMFLTRGNVQSIHGDTKYQALCSDANDYKVIFDGENNVTIWGISAKSFEGAWLKVKWVIDTIKDMRHFKSYNYKFVNCMSGYNIIATFAM